tara:strand:+ start:253 stop:480 length:228 start_codon:yes stop_codon:yes gene_type:complete
MLSIGFFIFYNEIPIFEDLIRAIGMLIISLGMFFGAHAFQTNKSYGRTMLIIMGILAAPLGLIISYYAYKESELI